MIRSRHKELRAAMVQRGYDGLRLAKAIGISNVTFANARCTYDTNMNRKAYCGYRGGAYRKKRGHHRK